MNSFNALCLIAKRNKGFSYLELVVVICFIAIFMLTAITKFKDLPAEAERAAFLGVLTQLKAGVNLQAIKAYAKGDKTLLKHMNGNNPMDYMLETPANYYGDIKSGSINDLKKSAWYFNDVRNELIYIPTAGEGIIFAKAGAEKILKFKVNVAIASDGRNVLGVTLKPLTVYQWKTRINPEIYSEVSKAVE